MVSAGLRLVLAVGFPFLGAAAVHEARRWPRACLAAALAVIAATAGLTLSVVGPVATGGLLERSFGITIPGVDLTARADSASIAVVLMACVAAVLAALRHRDDGERLAGILVCLGGAALVAAAGNLVLAGGGVEAIAAGTLLLRGRRGPGGRGAALLALALGGAGVALVGSAAELVAAAGTSDLAFVQSAAVGPIVAVPWALAGAALILSPAVPGPSAPPARDFAAIAALPAGFLLLLRLQQAVDGPLPAAAAFALTAGGALAAVAVAAATRGATGVAAAGRAVVAAGGATLVVLMAGALSATGTAAAGLLVALELGLLATPSWSRLPTRWAAVSLALTVLPGAATFAFLAAALAAITHRGVSGVGAVMALVAALCVAAMAAARAMFLPATGGRPSPGVVLAIAGGVAGGLVPGLALRTVAAPLAGGAGPIDADAGALALPGGGFAGGYLAIGALVILLVAGAALVLVTDGAVAAAAPAPGPPPSVPLRHLLRWRRLAGPALRVAAATIVRLDRWLEAQPGVPLFIGAVALALVVVR